MTNVDKTLTELYKCFHRFNDYFFSSKLPEPAITIQTKGKRNALGWCSTDNDRWKSEDEKIKRYEINISAEHINRPIVETMDTLLHEMVHLYNMENGVQDCSRGGSYHNKRFKEASERFGFYYDMEKPDKKHGWSFSKLKPETVKLIESWPIDKESFSLARKVFTKEGGKKKSNSFKLECPSCETKVRASKEGVKIKCAECDVLMQEM